jgi:hypothetical protein
MLRNEIAIEHADSSESCTLKRGFAFCVIFSYITSAFMCNEGADIRVAYMMKAGSRLARHQSTWTRLASPGAKEVWNWKTTMPSRPERATGCSAAWKSAQSVATRAGPSPASVAVACVASSVDRTCQFEQSNNIKLGLRV